MQTLCPISDLVMTREVHSCPLSYHRMWFTSNNILPPRGMPPLTSHLRSDFPGSGFLVRQTSEQCVGCMQEGKANHKRLLPILVSCSSDLLILSFVLQNLPCPENSPESGLSVCGSNYLSRINPKPENTLMGAWHMIYSPQIRSSVSWTGEVIAIFNLVWSHHI